MEEELSAGLPLRFAVPSTQFLFRRYSECQRWDEVGRKQDSPALEIECWGAKTGAGPFFGPFFGPAKKGHLVLAFITVDDCSQGVITRIRSRGNPCGCPDFRKGTHKGCPYTKRTGRWRSRVGRDESGPYRTSAIRPPGTRKGCPYNDGSGTRVDRRSSPLFLKNSRSR
jgi:hypothetical protein